MALPVNIRLLILVYVLAMPFAARAEIYKWVDAQGQVHFSDKRYASEEAKRIDDDTSLVQRNGNEFLFYPEADALLRQNQQESAGVTPVLSAGNWNQDGTSYQTVSLLRFDVGPLLEELHRNPQKKLLRATLRLSANGEDKLYGQSGSEQDPAGHFGKGNDNAFYLKPVHNNFDETTVTWNTFFNQTHYTPNAIRTLPGVAVPGSDDNNMRNYEIDVLPLVQKLMAANLRQLTLEMRLQRTSGRAQVTFYSREAEVDKRPSLSVDLLSESGG